MSGEPRPDCLFCRIVRRELPAKVVHEDERLFAFEDIHPKAPVHVLIIPKRHFASLADVPEGEAALLGEVLFRARALAEARGVAGSGYRVVVNTGPDAGQSVFHVHFHLLGGRTLQWPPG